MSKKKIPPVVRNDRNAQVQQAVNAGMDSLKRGRKARLAESPKITITAGCNHELAIRGAHWSGDAPSILEFQALCPICEAPISILRGHDRRDQTRMREADIRATIGLIHAMENARNEAIQFLREAHENEFKDKTDEQVLIAYMRDLEGCSDADLDDFDTGDWPGNG